MFQKHEPENHCNYSQPLNLWTMSANFTGMQTFSPHFYFANNSPIMHSVCKYMHITKPFLKNIKVVNPTKFKYFEKHLLNKKNKSTFMTKSIKIQIHRKHSGQVTLKRANAVEKHLESCFKTKKQF